jgi:hypothetical protein
VQPGFSRGESLGCSSHIQVSVLVTMQIKVYMASITTIVALNGVVGEQCDLSGFAACLKQLEPSFGFFIEPLLNATKDYAGDLDSATGSGRGAACTYLYSLSPLSRFR